jgi:hypothetical protein
MSEEALSKHINELIAHGEQAPVPESPEIQELTGTVLLAQSALASPTPTAEVEAASRDRLLTLRKNESLSPRDLQDVTGKRLSVFSRVWLIMRRFFGN